MGENVGIISWSNHEALCDGPPYGAGVMHTSLQALGCECLYIGGHDSLLLYSYVLSIELAFSPIRHLAVSAKSDLAVALALSLSLRGLALFVRSCSTSYTSTANQLQASRPSVYYSVRLDP